MRTLFMIIVSLFFAGCMGKTPTYNEAVNKTVKEQKFNEPTQWTKAKDNGKVNTAWVKTFNDKQLESLVAEALSNNKQIRAFKEKIESSKALVKQSSANMKPTVSLAGEYSDRNNSGLNEVYGGGLTASWEPDIWGRLELGVKASQQNLNALQSDYEFARQLLVASTSRAWFMTTSTKLQMNYAKNVVALLTKELATVKVKYEVGQVDKRSVYLAKSNLSLAKNALSKATVAYETSQKNLELLLGRYPASLIKGTNKLVSLPVDIPSGMPSELLERRPDIIAAEKRVAQAFFKQKESELLHLPRFKFSIGGLINNLTDAITNLTAGLIAPLYTGGAIEAEVEKASAIQKQKIEEYAQVVLEAFKEVEIALSLEERLLEQEKYLKDVVEDNKKTLELTRTAFNIGKVEYLELSQVQNKLISSQIALLDISTQRIFNRIDLHLALGGGF